MSLRTRSSKLGLWAIWGFVLSCSPKAAQHEPAMITSHTLHLGTCAVTLEMPRQPVSLEATRITLRLDDACPAVDGVIVELDMRDMPMNVAPVTLTPGGPHTFEGAVMFTMTGRWRLTLRLPKPRQDWKDSVDVNAS